MRYLWGLLVQVGWFIGAGIVSRVRVGCVRPPLSDDVMLLAAAVDRGTDCWAAREPGECVTCGHEWIAGEIIGGVWQQYRRTSSGMVLFDPEVRRACCVCVEQQRVQGDPSLLWAQNAGVML